MKRIAKIFMVGLLLAFTTFAYDVKNVLAATGTLSISASSSVTVGSNFSVTIRATGSKIFYWQLYVSYDASKLKLVSGSTTIQGEADDATYGTSSVSKTLTFKALTTGSAYISVARGDASMNIDANFNSISYSTAKKTITINPVTPKSTNNNLSALSIDGVTLTPSFSANVTSYTTEIAAGTTEVNVNASAADAKASVSGTGKVTVVEGLNNINIVVTAEDGSKKTYTIAATVKELTPIEVKVGDSTYTVVRKKDLYTPPVNFTETTVKIGTEDVLAYSNSKIGTVLGLKDSKGNIKLYLYNEKTKEYTPYTSITINNINLYVKQVADKNSIPYGYEEANVKIGDTLLLVYNYDNDSNFYLIYGVDTQTGEASYYLYDKEKSTIGRFYGEQVKDLEATIKQDKLIMIVASGAAGLFILTSLILLIKLLKKKKNKVSKSAIDDYLEKTIDMSEQLKNNKRKK